MDILICIWLFSQLFFFDLMHQIFIIDIGMSLTPDRIIFLIIIVIGIFSKNKQHKKLLKFGKTEWLMILLIIICIISLFSVRYNKINEYYKFIITIYNFSISPLIMFWISKTISLEDKYVKRIIIVVCIICLYLSFTSIFEHYKIKYLIWPKYILNPDVGPQGLGRSRGPLLDSATMGRVLCMTFWFIPLFFIQKSTSLTTFTFTRVIIMIIPITAIYFTYTRGPWVGFAFSFLIIGILSQKFRRLFFVFFMLFIVFGFSGIGGKLSFSEGTLFNKRKQTVDYRWENYKTAIKIFTDNPITGIGYGRFNYEWKNYFSTTHSDVEGINDGNHNLFLGIIAEIGAIGGAIYIYVLYNMYRSFIKVYKNSKKDLEKNMSLVGLALMAIFVISAQFADLRHHQLHNNLLFLVYGIVVGWQIQLSPQVIHLRRDPRVSQRFQAFGATSSSDEHSGHFCVTKVEV